MKLAAAAAAALALAGVTPLRGDGLWTLAQLGAGRGPYELPFPHELHVRFRMPPGFRQGPRSVTVRVHFRMRPDPRSLAGRVSVTTFVNAQEPCGAAFFALRRAGGRLLVAWNAHPSYNGGGHVRVGAAGRSFDAVFESPCIASGVHGGVNELVMREQRESPASGAAAFASLVILRDSGLRVVPGLPRAAPRTSAELELLVPPTPLRRGATLTIPYRVRQGADAPAQTVAVRAIAPRAVIAIVAGARRAVRLPAGQGSLAHGSVTIRAVARGRSYVLFALGDGRQLLELDVR